MSFKKRQQKPGFAPPAGGHDAGGVTESRPPRVAYRPAHL
jgi:hypothetical protein